MNKKIFIYFFSLYICINCSCVINKHCYESYDIDIPDVLEYPNISRNEYQEYFLNDVYCWLSCDSTNYYPSKLRESGPYSFYMNFASINYYEKIVIDKIFIQTNLGNTYREDNSLVFFFDLVKDKNGNEYYNCYNSPRILENGFTQKSYEFNHSKGEIITVTMYATLYDKTGKNYTKKLKYILFPKKRYDYFDFLTDLF